MNPTTLFVEALTVRSTYEYNINCSNRLNRVVELEVKEIAKIFQTFGKVKRVTRPPPPNLGVCFVEMTSVIECFVAQQSLQG